MAPIILIAIMLNLVMVVDQELILPRIADMLVREHDETHDIRATNVWMMPENDNRVLLSGVNFDKSRGILHNFFVIERDNGVLASTIEAPAAKWDDEKGAWALGVFDIAKGIFDDIGGVRKDYSNDERVGLPVKLYVSGLSAKYIWLHRNANFKTLMSTSELTGMLREKRLKKSEHRDVLSERHFRITDPLINVTMLILGLPMLVSRERHKSKKAILLSLLLPGSCFVFTFACKIVGADFPGDHPELIAWLPLIIYMPVAVLTLDSVKT